MSTTTIGVASDIHGNNEIFDWLNYARNKYDIVMIGGDFGFQGVDLAHLLRKTSESDAIVVFGNHELVSDSQKYKEYFLNGTTTERQGLTIGGLSGSPPVAACSFAPSEWMEVSSQNYERIIDRMGPVDVLLSHAPPFDTKCDRLYSGEHIGSWPIRRYIEIDQPIVTFCGHVHESPGKDYIKESPVINVGAFQNRQFYEVRVTGRNVVETPRRFSYALCDSF